MASKNLGTLTLDLVAKIGGFIEGLSKADRESKKAADQIERNFKSMTASAVAVGDAMGDYIVRGIDAVVSAFPRLIDSVAKFQDLSEETGASAEDLAGFAVAAATAGVEMDSVAAATIKLTKGLVGVDDESKAAGAALEALGLNVSQFKTLDPAAQYEAVGKALAGFADGAEKTAVAVALFGKSGAEQLKVFKALEEQGGRSNILTAQQIALADEYLDKQAKLRAELALYAGQIATQFIEPTNIVIGLLKDFAKELVSTSGAVTALGVNAGVQSFAESAGRALAGLLDYIKQTKAEFGALTDFVISQATVYKQIATFDFSGAAKTGEDFRARMGIDKNGFKVAGGEAAKSFVTQFDEQLSRNKADLNRKLLNAVNYGTATDNRPKVKFSGAVKSGGGGGAKDDPTKALLDNEIKALENQIKQEQELLQSRNKFLDLYNGQGLISVSDYYKQKQTILDDAVAKQSAAYDAEIEALKKYIASAPKATDRAAGEGKLNEVIEKQAKLHREAGLSAIESGIKQVEAQKKVQAAVDEVNAKILEFSGNLREAAAIRFDAQNEGLKNTFTAEGNEQALKQLETLRAYTLAQADLNKTTQAFALAQGDLSIAEERIEIARKRGTMGEIEALKASGDARKIAVAEMQKQLAALLAINDAARSPEQNQQIERLKVQLEGLSATIDPLADKFNTLISDAAGNAFADFITGTKSAKDAFKDFANSVISEISRMVAKNLASSLFGSINGGSGGGIGGFLSGIFGGSGSSGNSDVLGAFIAGLGSKASGGYAGDGAMLAPAGIYHRGEYVLDAQATRRIGVERLDRANAGGSLGGGGLTVNYAVQGRIERSTQTQLAQKTRRATLTAAGRF